MSFLTPTTNTFPHSSPAPSRSSPTRNCTLSHHIHPSSDDTNSDIDLSIVIISWNTQTVLVECLESVALALSRSGLTAEIIVVDNDSKDGSADRVSRDFDGVRLIRNQNNRGFAAANNQALRIVRGRQVLLLNSDTLVIGDVLQDSVDYMNRESGVAVMGCRVLNADGSTQISCSSYPSLSNLTLLVSGLDKVFQGSVFDRYRMSGWARREEAAVDVISGCYLMVRREALAQVGLLDESFFFFGEETDWCRRFADRGWQVRFAPVGEIVHLGGVSAAALGSWRDVLLTAGFVRLHYKHSGTTSACFAWSILLAFNLSRCALWSARWFFTFWKPRRGFSRQRCLHFLSVLADYPKVWRLAV